MRAQSPGRGDVVVDSRQPRPGTNDQCKHELLAASCIWCTPRAGVEDLDVDAAREGVGWRSASFHSRCSRCREAIMPGDSIRRWGGGYVCEGCGS